MSSLPGRLVSPWLDGADRPERSGLERDLAVDVAVVGGGIVGLTAALRLQRAGARVALFEARRIGAGVTGNTTAKITSLHGLTYASLASRHGPEVVRAYGEANEAGLATVVELAAELEADCDLRRKPNFTYTEEPDERGEIEDEVAAASRAGLPASFVEEIDLPFAVAGAVRFADQAEFDPIPYLDAVAGALDADGRVVHEDTRVVSVSSRDVVTERGHRVACDRVIVATHLPILDRGLFFARAEPKRSYAITARIDGDVPQGMHIGTDGHSTRSVRWRGEELLIVAGEGHTMGHGDAATSFRALERLARERFAATSFEHRWGAHDYMPDDGLPYVGRLVPHSDRVLTATGMKKWGLAMGTAAAEILADLALGRENRWAETFDPWRRPSLAAALPLARHNTDTGLHFFGARLKRGRGVADLAPGEGRIVGAGLGQHAVHRDDAGVLHAVSARCTHLGCIVDWNGAERTWDCPCHGSRFAPGGAVISGPATAPLEAREPPAEDR